MNSAEDYTSGWIIERRAAIRHQVRRAARLMFLTALSEVKSPANIEQHSPTLIGHTRDISLIGLTLIVPMVRESDVNFYGVEGTLRLTLSLPNSIVNLQGRTIHYEWLDEDDRSKGFVIGVAITEMSDEDRGWYTDYLRTLED